MSKYNKHIFICVNERASNNQRGSCAKCGGMDIRMRFVKLINEHGLKGIVRANKSGCLDVCELGPAVVVYPDGVWYTNVQLDDVDEIFQSNIINNKPVKRLMANKNTWNELQLLKEIKN
ncbi:MAG: ferredoxin [Candidatus Marinimicrobia bacterium]|nr:ferredoxin [Candidatus Neomarinimicrobiota bacterium]